jgi:single-strand DNA-binding protein
MSLFTAIRDSGMDESSLGRAPTVKGKPGFAAKATPNHKTASLRGAVLLSRFSFTVAQTGQSVMMPVNKHRRREQGMAGSINKVILIGNLGRDPEVRHTNDGNPIVNLSIATSETWRDKTSGERRERTEWHRVVIFNDKLGEIAQKYLQKGSKVYLEGQLQTRKWTDPQGIEKYSTEVVLNRFRGELTMLDSRSGGGGDFGGGSGGGGDDFGAGGGGGAPPAGGGDLDDEIPF